MKFIKLRKILKNPSFIKIIVSSLIILFLFKFVNFQLLIESIKNMNGLILYALILIPICILLRAWRWMLILNKDHNLISLKDSYNLTLVGIALNIFLPGTSGDIAKSYYGYKWHGSKEEMLSSSIADKIIAILSLFFIGSITGFLLGLNFIFIFSIAVTIIFSIIIFYPALIPWSKLNVLINKFLKTNLDEGKLYSSFRLPTKIKILSFTLSLFAWILTYLQFFFVCRSFFVNIDFLVILAIAPLITLSTLVPFTINGLGSGDAMIMYLFGLMHIPPTLAILVSFISLQVLSSIIPGFIGFIIIIMKKN